MKKYLNCGKDERKYCLSIFGIIGIAFNLLSGILTTIIVSKYLQGAIQHIPTTIFIIVLLAYWISVICIVLFSLFLVGLPPFLSDEEFSQFVTSLQRYRQQNRDE